MNALQFRSRWNALLACHRELQPDALLRPVLETTIDDTLILNFRHSPISGWTIAFAPEGTLVKAYDLTETTVFTFADVRPHFVLPEWAYRIYQSSDWMADYTTTFRYAGLGDTEWQEPWLALAWWPLDAQHLLEPTDTAVDAWTTWFDRPDLAPAWRGTLHGCV